MISRIGYRQNFQYIQGFVGSAYIGLRNKVKGHRYTPLEAIYEDDWFSTSVFQYLIWYNKVVTQSRK